MQVGTGNKVKRISLGEAPVVFGNAGQMPSKSAPDSIGWPARLTLVSLTILYLGLVAGFILYRRHDPDVVAWGQQFLQAPLGVLGIVILLAGALTMKLYFVAMHHGKRSLSIILWTATIVCGVAYLGCLGNDYAGKWQHYLLPGSSYRPTRKYLMSVLHRPVGVPGHSIAAATASPAQSSAAPAGPADPARGRQLFLETCAACHGPGAQGIPHQGAPLKTSKFVAQQTDDQLLAFVKAGRAPGDAQSVMGLAMPARGGNPALDDAKLRDIIAFVRKVQGAKADAPAKTSEAKPASAAQADATIAPEAKPAENEPILVPKSLIAPPPAGRAGLLRLHPRPVSSELPLESPPGAAGFFSTFFLLTGVHAAAVAVGVALLALVFWRAARVSGISGSSAVPAIRFVEYYWQLTLWAGILVVALIYGT